MRDQRQPRYNQGQRIANRFLVRKVLKGGMGEVYLCLDEKQMLPLALKTFRSSSPDLADIFKHEVANWIALEQHPNIVRCLWMEKFDSIPFMVLEWVAGEEGRGADLRSWLRRGPIDLPLALRFTIDIVRGLIHANAKVPGIVHRDLKPENVLVNQSRQAKITDFGLATAAQLAKLDAAGADEADMERSRSLGNVTGTPAYMPPEQWRGDTEVDFRTDMYATGCILYELLTGRRLYDGRTVSELRSQHLEAPIPALHSGLPIELKAILGGCLAKQYEARFDNLNLLLGELIRLYDMQGSNPLLDVVAGKFTAVDYINRGTTFDNLGQQERAIDDYNSAIELEPNNAVAYSNRGNSYAGMGQHEHAINDYDHAVDLDSAYAIAYANRGNSYMKLRQHERAISDLDRAIQLSPYLAQAYAIRGRSYADLGQHERAICDYERAVELDPKNANVYLLQGNSYGALEQHERAISNYDRAIQLDPNNARAYSNRGTRYGALGQYESAISDFDCAIQLDPTIAAAYLNRSNCYGALKQYDRAIKDLDYAIYLEPDNAQAYVNRGDIYGYLGQYERAIGDYDCSIERNPNFAKAYSNRGNSYGNLGKHERAIRDLDRAIELDPKDARAYFNKAVALAKTNRFAEALQWGETAKRLGVPSADALISDISQMLGQAPAQVGGPQAAFDAFQRADVLDTMRQTIQQFPILKQMIPEIEQAIAQQVPPAYRQYAEERLAWLRQIVERE